MAAIPAVNSLVDGTHLDERGQPTVWREVLIKKSEATRAFVHYIGLDEQWDEWLPLHALAPRGTRARTTQIPDVARLAAAATTPRAAVRSEAHAQFATSRTIGVASAGRTPLRKAKPSFSAAVPPSPSTTAAAAGGGGGLEYVLPPAPSTPHPVDVAAAYTYDEQGGHASAHERYDDGSGYYDGTGGYDASFGGVSAPVGGHAAWSHYAASASPGGGGAYSASGGYAGAGGGYGHGPPATPPQVAAPGALPMQQFDGFDFAPASNHSNGVSLDADAEAFRAAQRATRSHVPSFGLRAGIERDAALALIGALRPALPVHERPMRPGEREEYLEIAKRGDPAELAAAAQRGLGPAGMVHYVRTLAQAEAAAVSVLYDTSNE